jgi:VWFA-related protein
MSLLTLCPKLRRACAITLVALVLYPSPARGQAAEAPAATTPPPLVVRVSTELVQIDAVVTDRDGHYVTDLQASDFELSENGKHREITNFRYVVTASPRSSASATETPLAAATGAALTRANTTRTLAIVVDDLSFSFETSVRARKTLANLVAGQLGPNDMVAIVRTSGGNGNLQQFTNDKRILAVAASGIPYSLARLGVGAPSTPRSDDGSRGSEPAHPASDSPGDAAIAQTVNNMKDLAERMARDHRINHSIGTLNSLTAVVKSLGRMPGRKSLLFLSEGLMLKDSTGDTTRAVESLTDLIDAANRASVVFYSLDPSGLQTHATTAADLVQDMRPNDKSPLQAAALALELRVGAERLAEDTGGLALFDTNDLGGAVGRLFDDQQGYYLLGYEPDAASFSGRDAAERFHRLSVKVRRRGLHVRSRRGFYARADTQTDPLKATSFADALVSPFVAVEVPVRLTALFNHDAERGSFLRCLLHIDAHTLTFSDDAEDMRTAEVEAGVLSIAGPGRVGEHAGGKYTLQFPPAMASAAIERGLVVTLDIPVEPGPYQVRAAVRDVASGRAGSASQFVDVPNLRKGELALSGIFMGGASATAMSSSAPTEEPVRVQYAHDGIETPVDPDATPAVRRFRSGSSVDYAFGVYNARLDPADSKPRLTAYLSLFRDGVRLQTVPVPTDATLPSREGVLALAGALRLGPEMQPGTYTLEVIVQDTQRGAKEPPAIQWIDFDIVG